MTPTEAYRRQQLFRMRHAGRFRQSNHLAWPAASGAAFANSPVTTTVTRRQDRKIAAGHGGISRELRPGGPSAGAETRLRHAPL